MVEEMIPFQSVRKVLHYASRGEIMNMSVCQACAARMFFMISIL